MAKLKRKQKAVPAMKACLSDEGCSGTGFILGFVAPVTFASCILCKGTGFTHGAPIGPREIQVRVAGNVAKAQANTFKRADFPEHALMAHAMAKAGIFPSVSQARKNGWDKPMETGEWTVGKRKIKVIIK